MPASPSIVGPLLAFVAILALIPVALWLLKRSPLGARWGAGPWAGAAQAPVRLVGSLSLAPSQRIVTVEVGQGEQRQWLVLGVSNAGIRTLHQLLPPADGLTAAANSAANPTATPPASAFARLLAGQRHSAGGTHAP